MEKQCWSLVIHEAFMYNCPAEQVAGTLRSYNVICVYRTPQLYQARKKNKCSIPITLDIN